MSACEHSFNTTTLCCTTCGALGRYEGRHIVAIPCHCGADATLCVASKGGKHAYVCAKHDTRSKT